MSDEAGKEQVQKGEGGGDSGSPGPLLRPRPPPGPTRVLFYPFTPCRTVRWHATLGRRRISTEKLSGPLLDRHRGALGTYSAAHVSVCTSQCEHGHEDNAQKARTPFSLPRGHFIDLFPCELRPRLRGMLRLVAPFGD